MLHIPILRHGKPYTSVDQAEIVHHATGEPVARISQANSGLIVRDIHKIDSTALDRFTIAELMGMYRRAAEIFMTAELPVGDARQSFNDYVAQLSATTGMPLAICRHNADKVRRVLAEIDGVIAGLTRGFDLTILDKGYGVNHGAMLSWFREARHLGAVLPSNSPGVHSLWIPAVALKVPIVLKPGREEPWTPYRVIESLAAAGVPREVFGFYPADHDGAGALLRTADRGMIFGDDSTTRPWRNDHRIEIHGAGYSKVLLGDDAAARWRDYLPMMASSIAANGGRSCINASAVWTPRFGREIAEALATELARVQALPADHPDAALAAFANPTAAERMSGMIDGLLKVPGAEEVTERIRGSHRLVKRGRVAYVLPTIIRCDDREHPLLNREFLFPYASVVECPAADMPDAIGKTLVVSAVTNDAAFKSRLMAAGNIDRLNFGPIPTWKISWDQPHEGNLFEHLYRQRAFQIEPAA